MSVIVLNGGAASGKAGDMDGFLKQHTADFVVVRDAAKKLVSQANISTMPTSFILDATGKNPVKQAAAVKRWAAHNARKAAMYEGA